MANYKGRTFTAACEECGKVFTSTHQYRADSAAAGCYEIHYPPKLRPFNEVYEDVKKANRE